MTCEAEGEAPRACPIRYLIWHEIDNDMIAGHPIAAACCPRCNSAMVFDARIDGEWMLGE